MTCNSRTNVKNQQTFLCSNTILSLICLECMFVHIFNIFGWKFLVVWPCFHFYLFLLCFLLVLCLLSCFLMWSTNDLTTTAPCDMPPPPPQPAKCLSPPQSRKTEVTLFKTSNSHLVSQEQAREIYELGLKDYENRWGNKAAVTHKGRHKIWVSFISHATPKQDQKKINKKYSNASSLGENYLALTKVFLLGYKYFQNLFIAEVVLHLCLKSSWEWF